MITKPMLATSQSLDPYAISYPKLASPKLDGIRALIHHELGPVTRSFKPIANTYIRRMLNHNEFTGLDGELVTRNTDGVIRTFNEVQGDVMRRDGEPRYQLQVFDDFTLPDLPFEQRYERAQQRVAALASEDMIVVPHVLVATPEQLIQLHGEYVASGYEGTMVRALDGKYKSGRATAKQEWLLKYKDWVDTEGEVVGFIEQQRNDNVAFKGELGQTKRSTAKGGMVPADTLGKLEVRTAQWGVLEIGCGVMVHDERQHVWYNQGAYLGRTVTFKYQPSGMQDKPRFPTFKGWRDRRDM